MDFTIDRDKYTEDQFKRLPKEVVASILDDVMHSGRNHWINLAKEDDSHLKYDYLQAIQPVDVGKNTWTVSLIGEVPHLLENGAPSQDMRETLLGSNVPVVEPGNRGKHESAKGGYYRPIPFRHATPSAGMVAGQAMGSAYSDPNLWGFSLKGGESFNKKLGIAAAKKLGKKIHRAAKKLEASTTSPYMKDKAYGGAKRTWGGRLKAGYAPKLKAHHKTDIYAGMVRMQKTYEKATQNTYMTFRTISTNVTEGWIRKAIPARNYADDTFDFINKMIPKAIESYIREVER